MAEKSNPNTPDKVILGVLVDEVPRIKNKESEAKIKKRLRYHKLGPYEQDRVELLRRLKNSLQEEIGRFDRSRYYLESHGRYAAMEDFDVPRMVDDFCAEFPEIERSEIEWFVPFAVFTYYLR